jgi:hypothetical protein
MSLDRQQRKLLLVLLESGDQPLSFEEIERAGVRGPASRVYELESRGHAIERVYSGGADGRHLLGIRLSAEERAALRRLDETLLAT